MILWIDPVTETLTLDEDAVYSDDPVEGVQQPYDRAFPYLIPVSPTDHHHHHHQPPTTR